VSLPETKTDSVTNKINVFAVLKKLITNPKVVTYGLLIGGANGVLFSYYAEAPFIFIEYFQLSPSMYGFLGIVVASASIPNSNINIATKNTTIYITFGFDPINVITDKRIAPPVITRQP
ncbi:multidrug effflux MFS transporter, partial [Bacillus sp. D-CC]